MMPDSANSLATSPMRRMFSSRSAALCRQHGAADQVVRPDVGLVHQMAWATHPHPPLLARLARPTPPETQVLVQSVPDVISVKQNGHAPTCCLQHVCSVAQLAEGSQRTQRRWLQRTPNNQLHTSRHGKNVQAWRKLRRTTCCSLHYLTAPQS